MGQLVEDAYFGQGEAAVQVPVPQQADLLGVEAAEAPDGQDVLIGRGVDHGRLLSEAGAPTGRRRRPELMCHTIATINYLVD